MKKKPKLNLHQTALNTSGNHTSKGRLDNQVKFNNRIGQINSTTKDLGDGSWQDVFFNQFISIPTGYCSLYQIKNLSNKFITVNDYEVHSYGLKFLTSQVILPGGAWAFSGGDKLCTISCATLTVMGVDHIQIQII